MARRNEDFETVVLNDARDYDEALDDDSYDWLDERQGNYYQQIRDEQAEREANAKE